MNFKKVIQAFILTVFISLVISSCTNNENPVKDIEEIISQMTLEEKISFIGGYEDFNIRSYDQYGIPEIHLADGPVGVRNYGESTSYPAGINLAASFDKSMAFNIGKAIGSESRANNSHIILGPAFNIYRFPLCGRNFEYMGEDPFLAGVLAREYTLGVQGEGVIATAKHYVANNQEFNRHHVSSDMDERTLHEIYLPAFKTAVTEGKVAAIMTSYNLINGIHASEHNYLNNEILKGKWGFEGFIMSDWVSTYDGLACAKGGLDLEMPSGKMMNIETLIPAIEKGELEESVIDDKIRRILNTYQRFDLFNNPNISENYTIDESFIRKTALDAARGGMVLLKNDEKYLPLKKDEIKSIAVVGPNGHPAVTGGGGSSYVDPLYPVSLYEAVDKISGDEIDVVFEEGIFTGYPLPDGIFDEFDFYIYKNEKKIRGVRGEFYLGKNLEGEIIHSQIFDELDLTDEQMWDLPGVPETDYSARFTCYYSPEESRQYSIAGNGDDGYRIIVDGVEVLEMWRDQGPTKAHYNSFLNAGQEYKIEVEYYQSGGGAVIELGAAEIIIDKESEQYPVLAWEAAKSADMVIIATGFNPGKESESFDRTFEMPYNQSEFINQIAKYNENVVVVLNAGGNVEMESWIHNVKGLLMAWYPGQEGNIAAAEILFGKTNPSGKLPVSFENRLEDNPAYNSYFDHDGDLKVFYEEGIFMGYRYWDNSDKKPRYPFGYGLSYTSFEYDNISTDKKEYSTDEKVIVKVNIKNIGEYGGAEAIQLYVSDLECTYPRPVKELKDFEKVFLKKGDQKEVEFELNKNAFSFYNPDKHDWMVEPGEFEILIGSSSADIRQKAAIRIK